MTSYVNVLVLELKISYFNLDIVIYKQTIFKFY